MAYCVNCGVKLRKSERKCPLCNTKVINSNKKETYEPIYPNNIEEFKKINFHYVSKLVNFILLILTLIVAFCDFVTSKTISWSVYVACATIYLSCHLSFIIFKKVYIALFVELIGSEFIMFVIAYLNNGLHWYLYLVLPFIFIIWCYIVLCIYLIKKENILRRLAISFLFSSVALVAIEVEIDMYKYGQINMGWSTYAALPIIIISILIYLLSYNRKLIEEIKQRLFI